MPEREEVQREIERILESHNEELQTLLADGYRVTITLIPNMTEVEVTQQINTEGRRNGIRILHDGVSCTFPPIDALLFAIEEIGYQRFHDNQKTQIVSRERPNVEKDTWVRECRDKDGSTWFVLTHSGTDRKISQLNNMFELLGMDWRAERS